MRVGEKLQANLTAFAQFSVFDIIAKVFSFYNLFLLIASLKIKL